MGLDDLLQLQGKCKSDPESYRDEFSLRLRHFHSLLVRPARCCAAQCTPRDARTRAGGAAPRQCDAACALRASRRT